MINGDRSFISEKVSNMSKVHAIYYSGLHAPYVAFPRILNATIDHLKILLLSTFLNNIYFKIESY